MYINFFPSFKGGKCSNYLLKFKQLDINFIFFRKLRYPKSKNKNKKSISKSNIIITINYPENGLHKIVDSNWIYIDEIKVIHKSNIKDSNHLSIPTYKFTSLKVEDKLLNENANTIDMGMLV